MTELEAPSIPYLSGDRLLTRERHLVSEITASRRHRHRRRFALGGAGLAASGVTTALVVLVGTGTPAAFAAWTPSPTAPSPGQVAAAEATCQAGATAPPAGAPSVPTTVSLTDIRGPFTLVLFGAATPTKGVLMCMSGPDGTQFSIAMGNEPPGPRAGQITLDRLQGETADGQPYVVAEGSAGSGVSRATLTLSDGSQVVATVGNGLFLAWWPGSATVTSAAVTSASGTTAQTINSPTVDTGGSGTTATGGTSSGTGNGPHTPAQRAEFQRFCAQLKAEHPDKPTIGPCAMLDP